jgi:hypothetical protein
LFGARERVDLDVAPQIVGRDDPARPRGTTEATMTA